MSPFLYPIEKGKRPLTWGGVTSNTPAPTTVYRPYSKRSNTNEKRQQRKLGTGENIKLGDKFIKLWQEAKDVQLMHMVDFLNKRDRYVPYVGILEELTKTLETILKPYEELKKTKRITKKEMVV